MVTVSSDPLILEVKEITTKGCVDDTPTSEEVATTADEASLTTDEPT